MKYLLSFWFVTFLFCSAYSQTDWTNPDILTILKLQDQRAPASTLLPYLESENTQIRLKAIQAFASLQQPSSLSFITPFLSDPDSSIRAITAYAIGQTGDSLRASVLLSALEAESVISVRGLLAESIGKIITTGQFSVKSDSLRRNYPDEFPLMAMRFATRFPVSPLLLDIIIQQLSVTQTIPQQRAILYAMARGFRQPLPEKYNSDLFAPYLSSPDAEIRKYAAMITGRCVQPVAMDALISAGLTESDPGVLVAIIRGIVQKPDQLPDQFPDLISRLAVYPTGWLQAATAQALRQPESGRYSPEIRNRLMATILQRNRSFQNPISYRDMEWLMTTYHLDPSDSTGLYLLRNHPNEWIRSQYAAALSILYNEGAFPELSDLTTSESIPMRTQAATEIVKLVSLKKIPADTLSVIVKSWLSGKDQALVTLAAGFAEKPETRFPGIDTWLINALNELNAEEHLEAMQALVEGIGQLSGPQADSVLVQLVSHPSPVLAEAAFQWCMKKNLKIPATTGIRRVPVSQQPQVLSFQVRPVYLDITTSKGVFRLLTLPDNAPYTVKKLVDLAVSGFYNGLMFHRLVPDFVIQGGDPRGDGWGGPSFTMRSEFGPAAYSKPGMAGVASSGKDTEGSQFFIVHSPTPHLDGRYTIWAEVVSGIEVVQELEPGDQILSVRVTGG